MKLYHGSNMAIKNPKIFPAVDFGNGFYLTSDYEQAKRWASVTGK